MKKKKILGYLLIFIPFAFIQYTSYQGNYMETGSWEKTFSEIFSSLPHAIGYNLWLIAGIITLTIIYKKNK